MSNVRRCILKSRHWYIKISTRVGIEHIHSTGVIVESPRLFYRWLATDDMECYSKIHFSCIKSSLLKMLQKS